MHSRSAVISCKLATLQVGGHKRRTARQIRVIGTSMVLRRANFDKVLSGARGLLYKHGERFALAVLKRTETDTHRFACYGPNDLTCRVEGDTGFGNWKIKA